MAYRLPGHSKQPLIGQQRVPDPAGRKDCPPISVSHSSHSTPLPPSLHIPLPLSLPLLFPSPFLSPSLSPTIFPGSSFLLPPPASLSFSTHHSWLSQSSHSAFSLFLRHLSVHLFDLICVSMLVQFPLLLPLYSPQQSPLSFKQLALKNVC